MHSKSPHHQQQHNHIFLGENHSRNEWRTWLVVALTFIMMVAEIITGYAFGSMALLADGFHMATHAGALSITGLAYFYARQHANNEHFSFGTGKLGELAGYSSAIILAVIALLIGFESVMRIVNPVPIRFDEAIVIATIGLLVNLISAWALHSGGEHHHGSHEHDDSHHHSHSHEDHNLQAAYLHVLTDALTSILAIVGLLAGRFYGWFWMDPLVGVLGGIVIAKWSIGLLKGAGSVLLDTVPDQDILASIRDLLEQNGDRVSDLHLWRIGPGHLATIIALISPEPKEPEHYKTKLASLKQLSHITIEVHTCQDF